VAKAKKEKKGKADPDPIPEEPIPEATLTISKEDKPANRRSGLTEGTIWNSVAEVVLD